MMIVAVTMVRDEQDVIETVIRHTLAEGVDRIIVADNLSIDDTRPILERLARTLPIDIVDDQDPAYYQDRKMTALARAAEAEGADWIVPFDADEIWYSPTGRPFGELLADIPFDVIKAYGWDHIATHTDDPALGVLERIVHRRADTQKFPKVMFRAGAPFRLHMGDHDVDRAGRRLDAYGLIEYRHFQFRSLEQMTRKYRNGKQAYDATDLPRLHGTHWREGGALTDSQLAARWAELCDEQGLIEDPAPIR